MAVKILFARGKYGWGPEETGKWITFLAATRVVILVAVVPFIVKFLRKPPPQPLAPRPVISSERVETAQAAVRWDAEAAKLKKAADTGAFRKPLLGRRRDLPGLELNLFGTFWDVRPPAFDLSTARWSAILTIVGYVVTSIPSSTSNNFLLGSAMTSPGALLLPALQSLALAIAAPDDAGKVLACFSALATFTASTIGPSLFGAVYVLSVDFFPELVFVVGAVWTFFSFVPLLFVKIKSPQLILLDEEDDDDRE